jgi:hypothetical protein
MSITVESLTAALVRRGVLRADAAPPPAPAATERPWFIGFVLGVSGWLAGIFGIIFVGMIFRPDSTPEFFVWAVLLLAAAYGLYLADRENAFLDQLALAVSIAGQIMAVVAIENVVDNKSITVGVLGLLQLGLLFAIPNRLARVIAALFACLSFAFAFRLGLGGEDFGFDAPAQSMRLLPGAIAWIVIWVPLMALAWLLISRESEWMASSMRRIVRPALTGLLIALSLGTLISQPAEGLLVYSGETKNHWLALWPLLSVGAALFAAMCALRLRSHALLGVAIAGSLLHVLHFYFVLSVSLLAKSGIMIGVGVLLFAAGMALRGRTTPEPEIAS